MSKNPALSRRRRDYLVSKKKKQEAPVRFYKKKWFKVCYNILAGLMAAILVLVVAYFVWDDFRYTVGSWYDGILQASAPPYARWPVDGRQEDYDVFDDDALTVTANEQELTAKYEDENRSFTAKRAGLIDLLRLRNNLDHASIGWLNAHTGTCYYMYTFPSGGYTYYYYQHLPNTGYVFVRRVKGYAQLG